MTPAERWTAAVDLQHQTVAECEAMGLDLDPEQEQRWCDLMNRASCELTFAYNALDRGGCPPTQDEWYAAWNVAHGYQLRVAREARGRRAVRDAEQLRADAAKVWERVANVLQEGRP